MVAKHVWRLLGQDADVYNCPGMTVFEDARVLIFCADYASTDASGKLNAIGAAFNLTQVNPQGGLTPPCYLVVVIDVPPQYLGTTFSVAVDLRRLDTNEVITVPGPAGSTSQALRIMQNMTCSQAAAPPGLQRPESLGSRHQLVLAFPTGLQLQPGVSYRWRVEIDGRSRPQWSAVFHVLAPAQGPVFGGPAMPLDPQLPTLGLEEDDEEPGTGPSAGL